MSRKLPHGGVDRARISRAADERKPKWMSCSDWQAEQLDREAHTTAAKPQCLVWVKTYCAEHRKRWVQCQRHTAIVMAETLGVGDTDEFGHYRMIVCRIIGSPDQLESAVMYGCIAKWEYVTNSRVPLGERCDDGGVPYVLKVYAPGTGPIKARPKPLRAMTVGTGVRTVPTAICDDEVTYPDPLVKVHKPTGGADEYTSLKDAIAAATNTSGPWTK